MIDLGISKLALIGVVALIVIGPEKLPRVARTLGALVGKFQRYVANVKAEVNEAIELEDFKKMRDSLESSVRQASDSMQNQVHSFESLWSDSYKLSETSPVTHYPTLDIEPEYRHPRKKWRLKRSVRPQWYKESLGVRRKALSGAARVAKYRPRR